MPLFSSGTRHTTQGSPTLETSGPVVDDGQIIQVATAHVPAGLALRDTDSADLTVAQVEAIASGNLNLTERTVNPLDVDLGSTPFTEVDGTLQELPDETITINSTEAE